MYLQRPLLTSLYLQAAGVKLLCDDLHLGGPVRIVIGVRRHLEGHLCIQRQQLLLPRCHIVEPEVDAVPRALCRPAVQGPTEISKRQVFKQSTAPSQRLIPMRWQQTDMQPKGRLLSVSCC